LEICNLQIVNFKFLSRGGISDMAMVSDKKRVLGRGLESLIPAARQTVSPAVRELAREGESVREIGLEEIEPSPYQPRRHTDEAALKELADSIRASGVMQPVLVREVSAGMSRYAPEEKVFTAGGAGERGGAATANPLDGIAGQIARPAIDAAKVKYQLIAGERRWLASHLAGKKTIPAIVRKVSNEQAAELSLIENLQREDLNPMEMAYAFARLGSEFGLTQEQIAGRTGKERATVANHLRLLKLPISAQGFLSVGKLTFGHAKVLMGLPDDDTVETVLGYVIKDGLSVRQTEELAKRHMWERPAPGKDAESAVQQKPRDPNVKDAERQLMAALGTKVHIVDKGGKGKVVIEYKNLEDFDRIIEALGK
jgi:ParB family chromosome partitioning protein